MANDSSIDEMVDAIASNLGGRYGFGGGGGGGDGKHKHRDEGGKGGAAVRGLLFDEADFNEPPLSDALMGEEEEEEDSGYDMEVAEEDQEPSTEEGFYEHIQSPQMQSIAQRRGWKDIAEAAAGARVGAEDEDPSERAKNLTVVSSSGKSLGRHVPRVKYSLQDAFTKVGGASSIVPHLESRRDPNLESGDSSSEDEGEASTSEEAAVVSSDEHRGGEERGRGKKRARDECDETTKAVVNILKRFGASPSDEILERLKDGERVLRRDEHRTERAKKRQRLETEEGEEDEERATSSGSRSDRKQEREYLRPRFKNSGVEYERFLQTYCPLCGYGDRVNDAIYAPKLAVIREMAETGVMEGDIGTLAHDLCTVWNEHIYKPMLAEGRRAMRLTYDMCRHHLLKPHRPDPRPMMRRDIEDLTMLIQIVNATIYTENGLTREGSVDPKMVAASINLYKTKYMIAGKRPETMAFYNSNFNFNERAAGGFVNPYQKVHFGGRRITRASKR